MVGIMSYFGGWRTEERHVCPVSTIALRVCIPAGGRHLREGHVVDERRAQPDVHFDQIDVGSAGSIPHVVETTRGLSSHGHGVEVSWGSDA